MPFPGQKGIGRDVLLPVDGSGELLEFQRLHLSKKDSFGMLSVGSLVRLFHLEKDDACLE